MRRAFLWGLGSLLLAATNVAAQEDLMNRAFELERRGEYTEAAALYREILSRRPADAPALLGLERALQPLDRLEELADVITSALESDPSQLAVYGVAIRMWGAGGNVDSVRLFVERWAAREPSSEAPYQEWGMTALQARDRIHAREAYEMGRAALGNPTALAAELAQLATLDGTYDEAVREWIAAVDAVPGYKSSAVAVLGQVPLDGRQQILASLVGRPSSVARRLAASLFVRWGDPLGGVAVLQEELPADVTGTALLQELLDELRSQTSSAGRRARGAVLETLAPRVGGTQASRLYLEAAQAYADGGDQPSARRMLANLATSPGTSPNIAASAATTLVGVLIGEGQMEEAEARFSDVRELVGEEERSNMSRALAEGWLRQGRLERAESSLGADSTVEGLALRGRILLYRGAIGPAREALTAAGPFAGSRERATERSRLLSLLQTLEQETLPGLGTALLFLARGDSLPAADALVREGRSLPLDAGGGEILLLASSILARHGRVNEAVPLLETVVDQAGAAAAAQATLDLAQLIQRQGNGARARGLLEHLILSWPTSALAPEARRLLELWSGAIPTR